MHFRSGMTICRTQSFSGSDTGSVVSWCFESNHALWRIIQRKELRNDTHQRTTKATHTNVFDIYCLLQLVHWCFKPSQPDLKTQHETRMSFQITTLVSNRLSSQIIQHLLSWVNQLNKRAITPLTTELGSCWSKHLSHSLPLFLLYASLTFLFPGVYCNLTVQWIYNKLQNYPLLLINNNHKSVLGSMFCCCCLSSEPFVIFTGFKC